MPTRNHHYDSFVAVPTSAFITWASAQLLGRSMASPLHCGPLYRVGVRGAKVIYKVRPRRVTPRNPNNAQAADQYNFRGSCHSGGGGQQHSSVAHSPVARSAGAVGASVPCGQCSDS